jgi:uncharacterized membrane protein YhhN
MKIKKISNPTWISSLLTAIGFFGAGAYYAFMSTEGGSQLINNIAKSTPSIMLGLWVLYRRFPDISGWLVTIALICTAIGDFLLEGVTETHFLLGIVANMIAHILYIIGFTVECKKLRITRAIIPLVYISGLLIILLPHITGFLAVAVTLYAIIIGLMAWRAAAVIGQSGDSRYDEIIGLLGAWLFVTCDTLIAIDKFVIPILYAKHWIMTSYWIGQWCIAYSIIVLFPGQKRARF